MPQNNSKFGDNLDETFQHSPPSAALSFDGYCCLPVKSRSDDILLPLLFFSLFFTWMGTGCAFIHGCSVLCAKHSQTTLRREHWKVWRTCEWDLQHPSCNLVLEPFILIAAPTTTTSTILYCHTASDYHVLVCHYSYSSYRELRPSMYSTCSLKAEYLLESSTHI